MRKRLQYLILPVITLVLEILPYGAVLNFMLPSTDGSTIGHFRELYSYFSLTPFGYANFAPLITAILTCAGFALLVIYCVTGKPGLASAAKSIFCIGSVVSLGPLLYGFRFYSVVGGLISLSLIAEYFVLRAVPNATGTDTP